MAGARMHYEPGGLVQNEQVVVFEQDLECDRFRLRFDLLDLGLSQFHGVAGADRIARPRDLSVEGYEVFSNQGLEAGPGKCRERQGEEAVQARAGVLLIDLESDGRVTSDV